MPNQQSQNKIISNLFGYFYYANTERFSTSGRRIWIKVIRPVSQIRFDKKSIFFLLSTRTLQNLKKIETMIADDCFDLSWNDPNIWKVGKLSFYLVQLVHW